MKPSHDCWAHWLLRCPIHCFSANLPSVEIIQVLMFCNIIAVATWIDKNVCDVLIQAERRSNLILSVYAFNWIISDRVLYLHCLHLLHIGAQKGREHWEQSHIPKYNVGRKKWDVLSDYSDPNRKFISLAINSNVKPKIKHMEPKWIPH